MTSSKDKPKCPLCAAISVFEEVVCPHNFKKPESFFTPWKDLTGPEWAARCEELEWDYYFAKREVTKRKEKKLNDL